MKNLLYVGGDDVRELSPTDLESLGVENPEATVTFTRGKSVALDDDLADVLLNRVRNLREATDEEMLQEERNLEAELGFAPYNPSDYTVNEVTATLASSSEARRNYILDQERVGLNRKTVFSSVGAEYDPESNVQRAVDDIDVLDETTDAGGTVQESTGTPSTTSGGANTNSAG